MTSRKTFLSVLAMAFLAQIGTAVDYRVGGPAGGWDTSTDLSTWAGSRNFMSGDSLTFKYPSFHDVVEVAKADYDTCSGSNPLGSYTGGSTTIKLTAPGKRYFICGAPGHCAAGMKLQVDVAAGTSATTAPAPARAPAAAALAPKQHSKHKRSIAPSLSPEVQAPPTSPSVDSELPVVSAPTPSPMPVSGAAGSARWAQVALGLSSGLLLFLTI